MSSSKTKKTRGSSEVTEVKFEYRCTRKKCGHTQWVTGIPRPDGGFSIGSRGDFCDGCTKMTMKRTGRALKGGKRFEFDETEPLEVVESTKTYDVNAHVCCGSISHYLWEVGANEGVQPNALALLTKLKGEGGRVRVSMRVELLRPGNVTKPFHPKGCVACNTHTAAPGKMHIAFHDSTAFREHNMERRGGSGVYCGLKGQPIDWPKGNHWVGSTRGRLERATCKKCLKAYALSKKKG